MINLEWAHLIIGALGAIAGAAGGIFIGGWRLGRIEGRLKLHFKEAIEESESHIEGKLEQARQGFDDTLKGLRQKINDVELNSERRFFLRDDFKNFLEEYRDNTNRIFEKLDNLPRPNQ